MGDLLSPADKQSMVSSFLEIAVGQNADTARQFLQATSWKLEEAIQLFYVGNEGGIAASSSYIPPVEDNIPLNNQNSSGSGKGTKDEHAGQDGEDEVRAPLPVIREALYGDAAAYGASRAGYAPHAAVAFRDFNEEMKRPGVWEAEKGGTSTADKSPDNLAALYRPPFALMYQGSFEKAKVAAAPEDKWLLVNLQSTKEFSSHMLNRDTWANEAVAQTIKSNFIFWQVYDDTGEGKKVCTYYKVTSVPVVLVIDPITGQKMRSWSGMIHPDRLLEDLLPFMDNGPQNHHVSLPHKRPRETSPAPVQKIQEAPVASFDEDEELQRALAASMEANVKADKASEDKTETATDNNAGSCSVQKRSYPSLPEELEVDKSLLCRVGFRLPDGRRVQRNFLRSDPIQLLWSFCYAQLGEEDKERPFRLAQAIPGSSKSVDYDSELALGESGLANSMISVTWE